MHVVGTQKRPIGLINKPTSLGTIAPLHWVWVSFIFIHLFSQELGFEHLWLPGPEVGAAARWAGEQGPSSQYHANEIEISRVPGPQRLWLTLWWKEGHPRFSIFFSRTRSYSLRTFLWAGLTIAYLGLEQKMTAWGKVAGRFPRGPQDFGFSSCLTQETAAVMLTAFLCY